MQTEPAAGRPWTSLVGLSLDQLVSWGVLYYSYSVLSLPIARDLGVSTSTVAAAFSCSLLVSALLASRVGLLLDRRGARPVLLCGAVIAPMTFGALAAVQRELALVLVFTGLGVAQALSLYEPAFRAVVDWFPAAQRRSRALLVLTSVAGFASTLFLPLTALLLDVFGWRKTVLVLAVLTAAVTVPVRLSLPRQAPSARPERAQARPKVLSVRPSTSLLSAGFALQSFAATGATFCMLWQLVERGETLAVAASLAGLAGASQVPGRWLLSLLGNLVPTDVRLPLLLIIQGLALVGIALLSGPVLVVALIGFGAAAGVMTLERAAVVIECFGRESFGSGSGQLASGALFARAGAPLAVELLHGSVSYAAVLAVLAVCMFSGATLLGIATRPLRSLPALTE